MTRSTTLLVATIALLTACGPKGPETEGAAAPPPNDAQRAAAVSNAMRSAPTKGDSILAAHGLTADQLEDLMYRVAADSALNAEYRRLIQP